MPPQHVYMVLELPKNEHVDTIFNFLRLFVNGRGNITQLSQLHNHPMVQAHIQKHLPSHEGPSGFVEWEHSDDGDGSIDLATIMNDGLARSADDFISTSLQGLPATSMLPQSDNPWNEASSMKHEVKIENPEAYEEDSINEMIPSASSDLGLILEPPADFPLGDFVFGHSELFGSSNDGASREMSLSGDALDCMDAEDDDKEAKSKKKSAGSSNKQKGYVSCDVCAKNVRRDAQDVTYLLRHMKTHCPGPFEFECSVPDCKYSSAVAGTARRHIKKVHSSGLEPIRNQTAEMQRQWKKCFDKCFPKIAETMTVFRYRANGVMSFR